MAKTDRLEGRLEKDEDAERRLERSWLLNVEGFLARRSPGFVILVATARTRWSPTSPAS